jgi:hypothetical protein
LVGWSVKNSWIFLKKLALTTLPEQHFPNLRISDLFFQKRIVDYEPLNANLRLVFLTQVSKHPSDP